MKKNNVFLTITAVIGCIASVVIFLYVMRDHLKNCPFCSMFLDDGTEELEEFIDDDFLNETEDLTKDSQSTKEEKPHQTKVRRGYIPLKFHSHSDEN